jgi:hypothetical protein
MFFALLKSDTRIHGSYATSAFNPLEKFTTYNLHYFIHSNTYRDKNSTTTADWVKNQEPGLVDLLLFQRHEHGAE